MVEKIADWIGTMAVVAVLTALFISTLAWLIGDVWKAAVVYLLLWVMLRDHRHAVEVLAKHYKGDD